MGYQVPGMVVIGLAGELRAEASGEFEIVCTLPGHREAGHVAILIVS